MAHEFQLSIWVLHDRRSTLDPITGVIIIETVDEAVAGAGEFPHLSQA